MLLKKLIFNGAQKIIWCLATIGKDIISFALSSTFVGLCLLNIIVCLQLYQQKSLDFIFLLILVGPCILNTLYPKLPRDFFSPSAQSSGLGESFLTLLIKIYTLHVFALCLNKHARSGISTPLIEK